MGVPPAQVTPTPLRFEQLSKVKSRLCLCFGSSPRGVEQGWPVALGIPEHKKLGWECQLTGCRDSDEISIGKYVPDLCCCCHRPQFPRTRVPTARHCGSPISATLFEKEAPVQSMISVLLFSHIVKRVEIGNSDSPGSLLRNFTRWNN